MNQEEARAFIEPFLDHKRLSKVEEIVWRYSWEGLTYQEMAEACDYETGHLKDKGSQLWHTLSQALGEKISKKKIFEPNWNN